MTASISNLKTLTMGYLGPEGSHSFQATECFLSFWKQSAEEDSLPVFPWKRNPYPNFIALLEAMSGQEVQVGIIPIENALEGSVVEVMEAIGFQAFPVQVLAEFCMPIQHCLIRHAGSQHAPVLKVLSHPMALAQCRQTLYKLFGNSVQTLATTSTSEAVRLIAHEKMIGETPIDACAAIGTRGAAEQHGLVVVTTDLSDVAENETRFLLITHSETNFSERFSLWQHYPQKTSLCFDLEDRAGSLVDVLTVFKQFGINLTKIESRPTRKGMGSYMFFVDTEGDITQAVSETGSSPLALLKKQTTFLNILGPFASLPRLYT